MGMGLSQWDMTQSCGHLGETITTGMDSLRDTLPKKGFSGNFIKINMIYLVGELSRYLCFPSKSNWFLDDFQIPVETHMVDSPPLLGIVIKPETVVLPASNFVVHGFPSFWSGNFVSFLHLSGKERTPPLPPPTFAVWPGLSLEALPSNLHISCLRLGLAISNNQPVESGYYGTAFHVCRCPVTNWLAIVVCAGHILAQVYCGPVVG